MGDLIAVDLIAMLGVALLPIPAKPIDTATPGVGSFDADSYGLRRLGGDQTAC